MDTLSLLTEGTLETLLMVGLAAPICGLLGLLAAVLLVICRPDGLAPAPAIHRTLSVFTNIARSIPFLILIILLLPLTRLLVGTSIGTLAAIVPLAVGGIAYAARLAEASLLEVDPELIEAVRVMGATTTQIVRKVYLR